jgi:hypothetical protein
MAVHLNRNNQAGTGPRTRRRLVHRNRNVQVAPVPAQRDETADAHYTWAVNALLESGRTDLAYELAAGYTSEA